jgi:hypothetical protein
VGSLGATDELIIIIIIMRSAVNWERRGGRRTASPPLESTQLNHSDTPLHS